MQLYWTSFSALGFEGPAMLATAKNDEGTPWRAIPLIRMHWCVKKRWNVYLSTFQLKGSTMLSKTPKTCSQIMLTSHFPISAGDEKFKNSLKCLLLNFLKGTNAVIKKAKTKNMLSSPLVEVISAGGRMTCTSFMGNSRMILIFNIIRKAVDTRYMLHTLILQLKGNVLKNTETKIKTCFFMTLHFFYPRRRSWFNIGNKLFADFFQKNISMA